MSYESQPYTPIVCGPSPDIVSLKISSKLIAGEQTFSVVKELPYWTNNSRITVSFFGGTADQKAIAKWAFNEYSTYANIDFAFTHEDFEDADIRVSFHDPAAAWSAIGMQALRVHKQPTMELGAISQASSTEADRGIALHQVGHALGFGHEWIASDNSRLDPLKVPPVEQFLNTLTKDGASNFPQTDISSVMRYFIAGDSSISPNYELSASDKALATIIYPGRYAIAGGVTWNLLHATDVLKIPNGVASSILLGKVSNQRASYSAYVSELHGPQPLFNRKSRSDMPEEISAFALLRSDPIDDKDRDDDKKHQSGNDEDHDRDLPGIISAVILHPNFRDTVKKIAEDDLPKHGVDLEDYPIQTPTSSAEIQQGLFGLLLPLLPLLTQAGGGLLGGIMGQHSIQNVGYHPDRPLPADIQQGIFSVFTSVLKNPIFKNIVTGIVKEVTTGKEETH